MKYAYILAVLICAMSAQAQQRVRPAPTIERLKASKPLVEEAIIKSARYLADFQKLPDTPRNRILVAKMKAENDKATALVVEIDERITQRAPAAKE